MAVTTEGTQLSHQVDLPALVAAPAPVLCVPAVAVGAAASEGATNKALEGGDALISLFVCR